MAFIDKKDPVVLNIRLTSKGRELLSKGQLNFSYYAIGDSEIDYEFNKNAVLADPTYDPFNNTILRPADKNPDLLSFLTRNVSGDPYNIIPSVPSTQTIIENDIQQLGFFEVSSGGTAHFVTDSDHVKQPDMMVVISGVTGGTTLDLKQAPYYLANANEPEVGDLLLIRWTNPYGIDTTGDTYQINNDYPLPNLFYRIEEISSGSLVGDNLVVVVDRPLPNFNGSGTTVASAMLYYNQINYTGDTCYTTDETDDAILAFLENCQCPTVRFPFWNMSIIFTEEIVGVQPTDRSFYKFNSRGFVGFLSYIQQQAVTLNKLGVIHYTNNSVANTYAEELFFDIDDETRRPTLDIPLVMWHKSATPTLGLRLRAIGPKKTLLREASPQIDDQPTSLNTTYYDLADPEGNVVGKVFTDLKVFVIEDQELLFAMSYKSNRSWTLPDYGVDINANVTFGCPECELTYDLSAITTTASGINDGQLYVHDFEHVTGDPTKGQLLLEVLASGATLTRVFFDTVTGDTLVTGLSAGTYVTKVTDLGANECTVTGSTTGITNPTSVLIFYDGELTQSLLNPKFSIIQASPTSIALNSLFTFEPPSLGTFIGRGFAGIALTGSTSLPSTTGSTEFWKPFDAVVSFNNLTFTEVYTIYIRDVTGATINDYIATGLSTVWQDYVAVGTPFDEDGIVTPVGQDSGGDFITVGNYLATINPSINPIIGVIEFCLYRPGTVPLNWQESNKIYFSGNGSYVLGIRERVGTAIAAGLEEGITLYAITTTTTTAP